MWYVMQVYSGRELQTQDMVIKYGGDTLEECRIPRYIEQKKRCGQWMSEYKILFPGYLFVKTTRIDELYVKLKKVPKMTRVLSVGEEFSRLNVEEENFLLKNLDDDSILKISKGISVDGKVQVISGPLKGLEGYIKRVDRHKRLAWLKLPFFEQESINICMGLEIIHKI